MAEVEYNIPRSSPSKNRLLNALYKLDDDDASYVKVDLDEEPSRPLFEGFFNLEVKKQIEVSKKARVERNREQRIENDTYQLENEVSAEDSEERTHESLLDKLQEQSKMRHEEQQEHIVELRIKDAIIKEKDSQIQNLSDIIIKMNHGGVIHKGNEETSETVRKGKDKSASCLPDPKGAEKTALHFGEAMLCLENAMYKIQLECANRQLQLRHEGVSLLTKSLTIHDELLKEISEGKDLIQFL